MTHYRTTVLHKNEPKIKVFHFFGAAQDYAQELTRAGVEHTVVMERFDHPAMDSRDYAGATIWINTFLVPKV